MRGMIGHCMTTTADEFDHVLLDCRIHVPLCMDKDLFLPLPSWVFVLNVDRVLCLGNSYGTPFFPLKTFPVTSGLSGLPSRNSTTTSMPILGMTMPDCAGPRRKCQDLNITKPARWCARSPSGHQPRIRPDCTIFDSLCTLAPPGAPPPRSGQAETAAPGDLRNMSRRGAIGSTMATAASMSSLTGKAGRSAPRWSKMFTGL